jgi:hypothetical protein
LYLPVGYDKVKKEKCHYWFGAARIQGQNSAGQVTQNPNEFTF